MPNTNCCVLYCHASSARHTQLSWYRLPKDKETKRQWGALIRNDTLQVDSNGTSVCGLHFLGGRKTYDIRLPSIFPWTPEWSEVVNEYNSRLTSPASATCQDDHGYSAKSRKPALLTLDVPPRLSTCSSSAKRLCRRTTQNSSPNAKPKINVFKVDNLLDCHNTLRLLLKEYPGSFWLHLLSIIAAYASMVYNRNMISPHLSMDHQATFSMPTSVCSLLLVEMAIRKQVEYVSRQYHGYVDIGNEQVDDTTTAKDALVIVAGAVTSSCEVHLSATF